MARSRAKLALLASVVVALMATPLIIWSVTQERPQVEPPRNGGGNNNSGTVTPPVVPRPPPVVKVVSAPSAFPFVERWVAAYNSNASREATVQVSYAEAVDDVRAMSAYADYGSFLQSHSTDVAVTGLLLRQWEPLPPPQNNATVLLLPVSPHAVAIVYNIPGFPDVPSGLRLNSTVTGAIMSGNATSWNDPRISQLNPDISLPDKPIIVVREGHPGSATLLLERYVNGGSNNSRIDWPGSSVPAGSADVLSTTVRQTPYSVGYVDFVFAVQTRMTYAALQDGSSGQYVLPSTESIASAIANRTTLGQGTPPEVAMPSLPPPPAPPSQQQPGNSNSNNNTRSISYPAVGFYYAAVDTSSNSNNNATTSGSPAMDFARWLTGEGQRVLADSTEYPPLYQNNPALQAWLEEQKMMTDVKREENEREGEESAARAP